MLIKYHDMFILAAEVIKIIKERSALTMIVNNDEKDSSADKLNSTATKLHTELLSDHYFSDNDLYNDSDYENNINFRLCDHDQDKNIDLRLNNNDYDQTLNTEVIQLSIINILNSTHSGYIITDDDHSHELREIKDYINSLSERFTTAINASAIKIIDDDSTITDLSLQIIHLNNSAQSTLTVNIHTILNIIQH